MVICKSCKIVKPLTDYRIHKSGYRIGKCRSCEAEYQRNYYSENRELMRERKRKWMADDRAKNKKRVNEKRMAYHIANRTKQIAKMRDYYARRFFWGRAMKLRGRNRATATDLAKLWIKQRGLCALTGRRLNREIAQVDHILPKKRGGTDEASNLRWVCKEVNFARRELTDTEFIALCNDVMSWIGQRLLMVNGRLS